ncbi:putative uncharacterized domain protein [Pseudarthrobacter siccitolerans]|uniref:Uncharacterized domain protein n=1 Tax=Pseudarthrobacter siccitolerans TaxID=861266 RepID=A0A024H305_9MICC|nr:hypothetical protein [Pseudarthrobacter siccitolerans]CCQ46106.1 putative uncharacterized domain protein [Pseudarthrobacter siccitolerans]
MDVTYLAHQDVIDAFQHTDGWTSKRGMQKVNEQLRKDLPEGLAELARLGSPLRVAGESRSGARNSRPTGAIQTCHSQAAKVFSTGCTFEVSWMYRRTDQDDRQWADLNAIFQRGGPHMEDGVVSVDSVLLLGVQFLDGTKATTSSQTMYGPSMDMGQEPEGPVFEFWVKDGNSNDDEVAGTGSLWLWPLPPAGDLRLVAQWIDMGMAESTIVLNGGNCATPRRRHSSTGRKVHNHDRPERHRPESRLRGYLLLRALRRYPRRSP